jgi:hypothetical protein
MYRGIEDISLDREGSRGNSMDRVFCIEEGKGGRIVGTIE